MSGTIFASHSYSLPCLSMLWSTMLPGRMQGRFIFHKWHGVTLHWNSASLLQYQHKDLSRNSHASKLTLILGLPNLLPFKMTEYCHDLRLHHQVLEIIQLMFSCLYFRAIEIRRSAQKQLDLAQRTQFDQMRTNNGLGHGQYDVTSQCNGGMDEFERYLNGPFQR